MMSFEKRNFLTVLYANFMDFGVGVYQEDVDGNSIFLAYLEEEPIIPGILGRLYTYTWN